MPKLKLWVVGEDSPDPDTWSVWGEYCLVIAADEKQARELAYDRFGTEPVCEVPLDTPALLVQVVAPPDF